MPSSVNAVPEQAERKLLFRIRDLRQYFPVKSSKKLFVKANDGIYLDIYEGETFGLVGESGCGKSTLGRVLLQLYHQTHGRSMYYGRTLDDVAPEYIRETAAHLTSRIKQMRDREELRDSLEREYTALEAVKSQRGEEESTELYAKLEERNRAMKAAEDAYFDIVQIIGGLIVSDDLDTVSAAYLEFYRSALDRRKAREARDRLQTDIDEVAFAIGKPGGERKKSKQEALLTRLRAMDERISILDEEVAKRYRAIDALREKVKSHRDFAKHEAIRDEGIDLARLKYNEMRLLRRDLQLIFQDPYSSLNPRMTVGQIIGEGLQTHNFFKSNGERQQDYIIEVMEKCGLAPYMLHRYPHQFSGGQRQRIGIARSLAVKPRFVVCDEAVSALDVSIQSQIINLLQDLREEEHLTYLFISHDLSVIKYISDRVGVMYLGNLVELADTSALFEHPSHPYTVALLGAIPTTDPDQSKPAAILEGDIPSPINPPKGCKFHTRCKHCTDICRQVTPEFEEIQPGHFVACHHRL